MFQFGWGDVLGGIAELLTHGGHVQSQAGELLADGVVQVAGQLLSLAVGQFGQLLLQTDVEGLMEEMASTVRASGAWWESAGATCAQEHCKVATAREAYVRREGGEVFG